MRIFVLMAVALGGGSVTPAGLGRADGAAVRPDLSGVAVVAPAYNEEGKIGAVVRKVLAEGVGTMLVVDDHSSDATGKEAAREGAVVVRHASNRGVGAAIRTGLEEARLRGYDVAVIISGDDQHDPDEIPRVAVPVLEGRADLVQGSRRLDGGRSVGIPLFRDIATRVYTLAFRLATGFPSTDASNGFRALRTSVLSHPGMDLSQEWLDRYELEPYLLYKSVQLGLRVQEVPVTIRYHAAGTTKMRPFRDWWRIFRPLVFLSLGIRK